ncbi:glycosyltransferase family 2 protein [Saccharothrix syringae]|uniref:Glycosyltransferase family 2 protein n=1 Tax=Saccharothrix syringae TaxID=103733 RepID=A0A5Q0GS30_SACSY|nr:glycosyltransferase family 2 protein [Saccharothrix syringae]QFZ16172.1 glycosyltransferase family 2 protein [Saccharothrix syringae]
MSIHFVVPYYLDPRFLVELVDSVRAQTSDRWRLTIVDDRYPDTTAEEYVRGLGDPRIEYVRNERNLGATGNVCKCMTLGKEEYLVVMGADDALEPRYVEVVLEAFRRHPDAVMVHPGVVVVDGQGRPTDSLADRIKRMAARSAWKHAELDGPAAATSLMNGNWLYVPAMAFRNDAVPRIKRLGEFGSIADLAWCIDMLIGGGTLALDQTPVFRYRRHAESHSSLGAKNVQRFDEEQRYYAAAAEQLEEAGWHKAARAAKFHLLCRGHITKSALDAAVARDLKLAKSLVERAVRRV